MENVVWMVIMVPVSALFTGIGIYAMRRKKPMWFWSGTTVREEEIRDVAAYNRANGYMWIFFSLPLWVSTFMGLWEKAFAGLFCLSASWRACPSWSSATGKSIKSTGQRNNALPRRSYPG